MTKRYENTIKLTLVDFMLWRKKLLHSMLTKSKNETWACKLLGEIKKNIQ